MDQPDLELQMNVLACSVDSIKIKTEQKTQTQNNSPEYSEDDEEYDISTQNVDYGKLCVVPRVKKRLGIKNVNVANERFNDGYYSK